MTETLTREPTLDRYAPVLPTLRVMAARNLTRLVRLPAILVPMVVMPLFFVVAFTGSFDGIKADPLYPTDKVINWVAVFAMLQGASFAGVGAAGAMSNDLESGFMDRLLVSPVRRGTLIIGPLVYTAIRAMVPLTLVLIAAFVAQADFPGGVVGGLLLYVGGVGGALIFGTFGLAVTLRIGDIRAMTIVQLTSFVVLFPSTGQVPIAMLSGWMETVARYNPVTDILRMMRQGFLGDVTWADTWPGLVVLAVALPAFFGWARYELARRT